MSGIISGIIGLLNNFVVFFLNTYTDKNIIEQWNSKENQSAFVKMITDFMSKEIKDIKKKSKKNSKPKDENKPKAPLTAYFHFLGDNRAGIKSANPELSVGQISQIASQRWKALSEDERAVYDERARNDKIRYETEMSNYVPPSDSEIESSKTKTKTKKDKNAPKGAKSAYMLYSADNRDSVKESNPDMKGPEISKQLGLNWKSESEDVKNKYKNLAEEDKKRFDTENEEYSRKNTEEEVVTTDIPKKSNKKASKESEKKVKEKTSEKKVKEKTSEKKVKEKTTKDPSDANKKKAFVKFCKEKRSSVKDDNKGKSVKEITEILKEMWLELDEDGQQEYYDTEE